MNINFSDYIKFIVIIVLFVFITIISLIAISSKNKKNNKIKMKEKKDYINKNFEHKKYRNNLNSESNFYEGDLSLFFNNQKDIILIPYMKDIFGRGKPIDDIKLIIYPYNLEEIGFYIKENLKKCNKSIPGNMILIIKKMGYKSWFSFSKFQKSISIQYRKEKGLIMYPTINKKNGKYLLIKNHKKTISIEKYLNDKDIGLEIMNLIRYCK